MSELDDFLDVEWKIVHRHGDRPTIDESPPAVVSTT